MRGRCSPCGGTGYVEAPAWAQEVEHRLGDGWFWASDLARELGWSHSTALKRLDRLRRMGLVESESAGSRGRQWRWLGSESDGSVSSPVAGPTVGDWQRSVRDGQESAGEDFEDSRVDDPDWEVE